VNAVTKLDLLQVETLLSAYEIGDLIRYWPASGGIENSNYFCATARRGREQQWVLTVLEQAANAGTALVPLLDVCAAAGLPVPVVLRDCHGEPFASLDGKPAMLCPRLPGRHVCNPTLQQVQAVGRFLARFHLATASSGLCLPGYPRDADWLERNARECQGYLPYGAEALLTSARRTVTSALSRQDMILLPRGVIHGDLFRDNVLFDSRGLTGVLDFHHAADGFLLYDLAVAINDWCTDSQGALDHERTLSLLRAYHSIRPVRSAELWYLPIFLLYAGLAFWLSRLRAAMRKRRGQPVRTNNPEELQRIVAYASAHFLYLDLRELDL
jgi:homoserine kinase type II